MPSAAASDSVNFRREEQAGLLGEPGQELGWAGEEAKVVAFRKSSSRLSPFAAQPELRR